MKKEREILTEGPSDKGFYVELYLEHLEEASFLYETRLGALNDPEFDWVEIEAFEERMEPHIDALVVGESLALSVCRMQAEVGDFGELFAAISLFCRQRQKEALMESLDGIDWSDWQKVRAVSDALKHEMPQTWIDILEGMLSSGDPIRVRIASDVAGWRRFALGGPLRDTLMKETVKIPPELIWALGRIGDPALHELLRKYLDHGDDAISYEASLALLRRGRLEIVPSLLAKAESQAWPFLLIGLAGTREMADRIQKMVGNRKPCQEAILALGFLGELSSIDILMDLLMEKEMAHPAATALNLILGADLFEDVAVSEAVDPDALFEDEKEMLNSSDPSNDTQTDGGDGRMVRSLSINRDRWRGWWAENKKGFDPKKAYRVGKPLDMGAIVETLTREKTPHMVRRLSFEEFVIKGGKDPGVEADASVSTQKRALSGIA